MEYKYVINPEQVGGLDAPISFGIKTNYKNILFTSGIVAINQKGVLVGGSDIKLQTNQVMENIKSILLEAKMTFDDIIKINMYLKNMKQLKDVIEVRSRYLMKNKPAATAVEVSSLADPRFLIEIEVIAANK